MENNILKFTMKDLQQESTQKLIKLNDESINYGLILKEKDIEEIMKNTNETLKRIGRIETSTNTLEKIIEFVYSSPYTDKDNYIENINDMQEVFYYLKSQVLDLLSDDEVIDILREVYDDKKGEIFQIQGFVEEYATKFKFGGSF